MKHKKCVVLVPVEIELSSDLDDENVLAVGCVKMPSFKQAQRAHDEHLVFKDLDEAWHFLLTTR